MRTTVTLDPDNAQIIKRLMRERRIPFKQVINELIRKATSLSVNEPRRYKIKPRALGFNPNIDLTKALNLAALFEDDELARKAALQK